MSARAAREPVAVPDLRPRKPPRLEAYGITKRFGAQTVLDGAGLLAYESPAATADRAAVGRAMAGH